MLTDIGCVGIFFFFFQAEDGIRDLTVTGVQTCALPISSAGRPPVAARDPDGTTRALPALLHMVSPRRRHGVGATDRGVQGAEGRRDQIGRASCRERV